ncbi:EscF/YscF/HrpA family type III secretion system needle major subunit [Salmonella enterica subsp. enterica serovar Bredeney]|nr:EscF/YscF/HrpA family type III secretion system needle major subunit [Salmonella enterica subsp. enterica serovar Bredeney]EDO5628550.1 EscF/YscF/HrpA family type III secretion system needle major subunit [Salmonella enterica]EDR9399008.1 EscF/YscF/HrpA family type III secretion system needle major subunit [Salmonella enterica subsp. enterica]EDT6893104.1 EscF/YscF/HrpA family type III secretion system needle major subunit [Salmonella enterica subsp. enterica serovar Javiana]HCM6292650.1 typ
MTDAVTNETYYLAKLSEGFETGAKTMLTNLASAETDLEADPSNPATLAKYQARLQEYTLFRNAQTTTVKVYKDIGAAIIQNFR